MIFSFWVLILFKLILFIFSWLFLKIEILFYSHANFESNELNAILNACNKDNGYDTSQVKSELLILPNCIEIKSSDINDEFFDLLFSFDVNCWSLLLVVDCEFWFSIISSLDLFSNSSVKSHCSNWKFFTLALVTLPLKFKTYDCVSSFL